MRNLIQVGVVVAATLFAGVALAQVTPEAPVVGLQQTNNEGVPTISTYTFHWSQNPAPVSSFTSDPGFVEHSHGRP
jgi:hypothetical protein